MSVRPTKKQQELLIFIGDFIKKNGYSPSYREIQAGCDYNSVATVAKHVANLIARGHLRKRDKSARSIEVVGDDTVQSTGQSHQEWLCGQIDLLLKKGKKPDDLYVLVGALKVLGFEENFKKYADKIR